jgi:hypothetical protein
MGVDNLPRPQDVQVVTESTAVETPAAATTSTEGFASGFFAAAGAAAGAALASALSTPQGQAAVASVIIPVAEVVGQDGTSGQSASVVSSNDPDAPNEPVSGFAKLKGFGALLYQGVSSAAQSSPLKAINSRKTFVGRLRRELVLFANPREFSRPADRLDCLSRIRNNVAHLPLTYGLIYGMVAINTLLSSVMLVAQVALVSGLGVFFFVVTDADAPVTIGGYKLGKTEKKLVVGGLSAFLFLFGGFVASLIWVAVFGSLFVGLHAGLRNKIELDLLEEAQLENGEEASPFVVEELNLGPTTET